MLSKTAVHAVRAMIVLATLEPGRYEGAASIAARVGAPANYLGKLLQGLARQGLVVSQKGLGGGWALGRPAERIRLVDILEPVEDVDRWRGCFLGQSGCSDEHPCHVHETWAGIRDRFFEFVDGTTLADLVAHGGLERLADMVKKGS